MWNPIRLAVAAVAVAGLAATAAAQEGRAQAVVGAGELTVTLAWARATPPGAATAAGYLTITNNGATDDRLIAVETPLAAIAEVHEMSMDNDRMVMRPLEDGLVIPAGETVALLPGGYHLMFIDLNRAVVEGAPVEVTLTFANAGEVVVPLETYPIGSPGPAGAGGLEMDGMEMGGMNDGGGGQ